MQQRLQFFEAHRTRQTHRHTCLQATLALPLLADIGDRQHRQPLAPWQAAQRAGGLQGALGRQAALHQHRIEPLARQQGQCA